MRDKKKALEVKVAKTAKKPIFIQRNHKKKKLARVGATWKKPRGLHNKLRRKRKGIGPWVTTGYKMPKSVRGLRKDGLSAVKVDNLAEIKKLNPKTEAAILSAATGRKNKIAMLKEAIKMNVVIANIKDPIAYIKKVEDGLAKKKESQKTTEKKKVETKTSKEDKKKVIEEQIDEKSEKKELDKLLTKKG